MFNSENNDSNSSDPNFNFDGIYESIRSENNAEYFGNSEINKDTERGIYDSLMNDSWDKKSIDKLSLFARLSTRDYEDEMEEIIEDIIKLNILYIINKLFGIRRF